VKLYTRHGDGGQTGLWAGRRVPKSDARIEVIGAIDECNAMIGLALTHKPTEPVAEILAEVQDDLFVIGCEIIAPDRSGPGSTLPRLSTERCLALEHAIDDLEARLPPLGNFIVPGGTPVAAHLHVTRAVCRRAERRTVALDRAEQVCETVRVYLNRLSDLLFVLARYENQTAGVGDKTWSG
jgi:cob(I)alamin adenosyltransferase